MLCHGSYLGFQLELILSLNLGIRVIIPLDNSSRCIWVCRILLNYIIKKDEEDGKLALIISIESWPPAFFDFKTEVPLSNLHLQRESLKYHSLYFYQYHCMEKLFACLSLHFQCITVLKKFSLFYNKVIFDVIDFIPPLSDFKYNRKILGFLGSLLSFWILFISHFCLLV